MAEFDIAVIGGDRRTAYMVSFLMEKGYRVICYKVLDLEGCGVKAEAYADTLKQAVESADAIVGGIPLEKENILDITELSRLLRKRHTVFGGVIPEAFRIECEERGIVCFDFMREESIASFNAIATAEGTVLEALKNKETNIHGSRSLVLGYGRCGKVLAEKLKGLAAKVTVCCRGQAALSMAEAFGMDALPLKLMKERLHEFEYIYNTIPAPILNEEALKKVRKDALIIDIASKPGGVDDKEAKMLDIKAMHCLGLPGKYASMISAAKLADYVADRL